MFTILSHNQIIVSVENGNYLNLNTQVVILLYVIIFISIKIALIKTCICLLQEKICVEMYIYVSADLEKHTDISLSK